MSLEFNSFLSGIAGGLQLLIFSSNINLVIGDSFSIFGRSIYETIESFVDFTVPSDRILIQIVSISVGTNGSGFTAVMRKNGVDLPATQIIVPPATTGSFDTGMLSNVFYEAGDLMSIRFNKPAGAVVSNLTMVIEVRIK